MKHRNDNLNFAVFSRIGFHTASGNNKMLEKQLLDVLLQTLPKQILELEKLLIARKNKEIKQMIHSLQGTLSGMGQQQLIDLARHVEQQDDIGKQEALLFAYKLLERIKLLEREVFFYSKLD